MYILTNVLFGLGCNLIKITLEECLLSTMCVYMYTNVDYT